MYLSDRMIQPNGLSPRLHRQYHANEEGTVSVTPTSASSAGRFFEEASNSTGSSQQSSSKSRSKSPRVAAGLLSPAWLKNGGSRQTTQPSTGKRSVPTFLFVWLLLIGSLATIPWLRSRVASHPLEESSRALRAPVVVQDEAHVVQDEAQARCAARRDWGGFASPNRGQCAKLVPASVAEREEGWIIAVHVDRKPSSASDTPQRGGLRGSSTQHRSLPHQYFARAMEATLHSVFEVAPEAIVDVVVFTEDRWGGLVDEVGLPVDWNIPDEICDELGLRCTQSMVLLNDEGVAKADALECASIADVLVASEGSFSVAASFLSPHIKILTDKWAADEDDMKISLDPLSTVAGMPQSQRDLITKTMWEYSECSAKAF